MKRIGMVLGLALALGGCGSSSAAVDAGDAGNGGDAGGVDASGNTDAGTDAQTPPGSIVDAMYHYCVLSDACSAPGNQGVLGLCVVFGELLEDIYLTDFPGAYSNQFKQQIDCANAARSCTELARCAGGGSYDTTYCTTHSEKTCDGTRLVSCRNPIAGLPTSVDCALGNEQCGEVNGSAYCTDGNTCDADAGNTGTCNGARYITCNQGLESAQDCGALSAGATCSVPGSGGSLTGACVPANAAACSDPNYTRCDGNVFVGCNNGYEFKLDCGLVEAHCGVDATPSSDAGVSYACNPLATECSDSGPATCMGTHLRMCVSGRIRDVDCAQIGFTTCGATTPDGGQSVTTCLP